MPALLGSSDTVSCGSERDNHLRNMFGSTTVTDEPAAHNPLHSVLALYQTAAAERRHATCIYMQQPAGRSVLNVGHIQRFHTDSPQK